MDDRTDIYMDEQRWVARHMDVNGSLREKTA